MICAPVGICPKGGSPGRTSLMNTTAKMAASTALVAGPARETMTP